MVTTSRAVVKVTLGWEVAYDFEVWIMPHHAGVDLILGTDFMIPAGIRLDLYNSAVKLPDEMVIPLIRSKADEDERRRGNANAISTSGVTRGDPAINSAFKLEDVRADRTPALHDDQDVSYQLSKFEDEGAIPAVVADSAVQRPSVTTANPKLEVLLPKDVEANSEGLSWTVNTSSNSDEDDAFARTKVSSAVTTNSADEHSDAIKDYASREVLLPERINPNDDPAMADSALETMEAETGSSKVRRHADDTIYLRDKFERAEVRSAVVVNSANTDPDADDSYDLPEVSLLEGTIAEVGVTNSAATVFDPGGIDYSLGQAKDDERNSTRDPTETLRQHYLAIAATEDEQEDDVDDGTTNAFGRSGTDLELTDYAHEVAFLPDLTEVEPTELDYGAPNVKSSSHTPAQSARLVAELQKHEEIMISSGNALPPPAYGVLCDIDV
ncbi:hypothetical protein PInf_013519 [Phytophthora infestans]|nr:hypothetical protein PInf_013519 [Phytophthora infestans]